MKLEEATPPARERWEEVLKHEIAVVHVDQSSDEALIMLLDPDDVSKWGVSDTLILLDDGRVAESVDGHIGSYFSTFSDLLLAAAVRLGAS